MLIWSTKGASAPTCSSDLDRPSCPSASRCSRRSTRHGSVSTARTASASWRSTAGSSTGNCDRPTRTLPCSSEWSPIRAFLLVLVCHSLESSWIFKPGPTPNSTKVRFSVKFEGAKQPRSLTHPHFNTPETQRSVFDSRFWQWRTPWRRRRSTWCSRTWCSGRSRRSRTAAPRSGPRTLTPTAVKLTGNGKLS